MEKRTLMSDPCGYFRSNHKYIPLSAWPTARCGDPPDELKHESTIVSWCPASAYDKTFIPHVANGSHLFY